MSYNANCFKLSFFFSSRRRHTRLQGDWSSDVCSSDLRRLRRRRHHVQPLPGGRRAPARARSEERRVGKECSSRWEPIALKKKDESVEVMPPCDNRGRESKSSEALQ